MGPPLTRVAAMEESEEDDDDDDAEPNGAARGCVVDDLEDDEP